MDVVAAHYSRERVSLDEKAGVDREREREFILFSNQAIGLSDVMRYETVISLREVA